MGLLGKILPVWLTPLSFVRLLLEVRLGKARGSHCSPLCPNSVPVTCNVLRVRRLSPLVSDGLGLVKSLQSFMRTTKEITDAAIQARWSCPICAERCVSLVSCTPRADARHSQSSESHCHRESASRFKRV